jgi:tetratricopeptide (TPR) repeat protein
MLWKEEETVHGLADPLRQRGFRPTGYFRVNELPRYRMWTLLHQRESVFAIITEHDRSTDTTAVWLELIIHYRDGTTLTYTTLDIPDPSRTRHPSRSVEYLPGCAPGALYERLLQERPRGSMRPVTSKEFPSLFEKGYRQLVAWRKLDDEESYYADLIHNNLGSFTLPAEKAEAVLRENLALLRELGREFPRVPTYPSKEARWQTGLGLLYATLGQVVKAEAAYREALSVAEKLVREHRDRLEDAITLGRISLNLGNLYRDSGRVEAGLEWFDKAMRTLKRVLARDSSQAAGRRMLRHTCRSRAIALTQLGRHSEALADWDRLVELDQVGKSGPRWQRLRTLARVGERKQAIREAERLARKGRPTLRTLYDLACVYALCARVAGDSEALPAQDREQQAERDAARAIALLRQAVGRRNGKRLHEPLTSDPDLEALRGVNGHVAGKRSKSVVQTGAPLSLHLFPGSCLELLKERAFGTTDERR